MTDTAPDATLRDQIARALRGYSDTGGKPRVILGTWTDLADAVLPVVQAALARVERERDEALEALAYGAETLARAGGAEAAVQRVRDALDADSYGDPERGEVIEEIRAALDGEEPPTTGARYRDRHGEEWTIGTNALMHHHSYSQRGIDELRREYGPLIKIKETP